MPDTSHDHARTNGWRNRLRGLSTAHRLLLGAIVLPVLIVAALIVAPFQLAEEDAWISIVAFRIDSLDELDTGTIPDRPSIHERDITGVDVDFIADPFFDLEGETQNVFFEVVNRATGNGEIGLASGSVETGFRYIGTVLKEPFHLSYPHVFRADDQHWMIPESWEAGAVRLYRAENYPMQWSYVGDLVRGEDLVDPTPFFHEGRWWLFVGHRDNSTLDLWFSDQLTQGWTPHPQNPIVKDNPDIARPGGRIIEDHGRIFRVGQDTHPSYGLAVGLFEISELTPTRYRESALPRNPVLTASGKGWNADGMHHLDLQWMGDHWLGVADGHDAWKTLRWTSLSFGKSAEAAE